jgi:hypothetical protein
MAVLHHQPRPVLHEVESDRRNRYRGIEREDMLRDDVEVEELNGLE